MESYANSMQDDKYMESPAQLLNSITGQSTDIFRQDFLPDAPLQVFGERLSLDKGDQTRLFVVLNTGTHKVAMLQMQPLAAAVFCRLYAHNAINTCILSQIQCVFQT